MDKNVGIVAIVVGAIAIGLLVVFRFNTQVATGQKILVPQPSQNYSGYLSTRAAPAVSDALNGIISGVGSFASSWLTRQSATPQSAPTGAAAPTGPVSDKVFIAGLPTYSDPGSTLVGPQTDPILNLQNTDLVNNSPSLSSDNSYDPSYSLSV